ncbi:MULTISPECIES: hypothetical protein [Arthrobacter]|uniref:Uncharacterized protein n=1 Tax=Arthrobacter sunyaminii TaxID=2816859 RepID=A0A975S8E3_9MICC|nr:MULTISPECIES: hypothetical protein [Arthrobacter]MBO0906979.1 hypothetical protein [Arthrobacter sunyaminii]QWQ37723.1 hypothetical protein KG104_08490 [Arthrobacter sunyaminii]
MDEYVSTGTFWFTVALINAGLAEQKNRSRWNWFLVSLLLGPFATLLIVVWRAPEPVPPSMTRRGGWQEPAADR